MFIHLKILNSAQYNYVFNQIKQVLHDYDDGLNQFNNLI